MKFIVMFLFSVNAFAFSNLRESKCYKNYQYSFNKKLLYNLYIDLDESNRPLMDIYEKEVMEAATFKFDATSEFFYPKLLKSASELKLNPQKFQAIIVQGLREGHFCGSSDLFNPIQVKEYVATVLKAKVTQ